ncbi:MAG: CoA pyrophosphatase [Rhizobacter sp.]
MALSFDPQELPVASVDSHLPAVNLDELRAEAMRQRFAKAPAWSPEIVVERQFSERKPTHASVLVPLVQRDDGLTVLFTQRTDHLTDHPGQVSFPGGRAEPEDADAVATALREAEEEIGLAPAHVDVIGQLPTYTTGTGFIVTPVIGLVHPDFSIRIDPFEVAEVFEVPLAFLMNPANHRWHAVEMAGLKREFLSMPWTGVDAAGQPRHYFVWGATAAMLRNLYRFLIAEPAAK